MKKFAFISTNTLKKYYNFLLNKEKSNRYISDLIKISGTLLFIIICWLMYFRYISLASTQWYWLRRANSDLSALNFQYEIVKTEILEKNQQNRANMYWNSQTKTIIEINPELVELPKKSELTYSK
jgi:hypothetical protein